MQTLRYVPHSPLHIDIEKLLTDEKGNQVWAVIKCFNKENEMSFTFSSNEATDYPALGMCDTCGKRFTQGCEHSNTLEAQQWLAAYAATEQSRDNVEYFLETQKDNQPAAVTAYEAERMNDPFRDERLDPQLNCHNIAVDVAAYNVLHAVPANKEWAERRLVEETEKRIKYIAGKRTGFSA